MQAQTKLVQQGMTEQQDSSEQHNQDVARGPLMTEAHEEFALVNTALNKKDVKQKSKLTSLKVYVRIKCVCF